MNNPCTGDLVKVACEPMKYSLEYLRKFHGKYGWIDTFNDHERIATVELKGKYSTYHDFSYDDLELVRR